MVLLPSMATRPGPGLHKYCHPAMVEIVLGLLPPGSFVGGRDLSRGLAADVAGSEVGVLMNRAERRRGL
jgi:hypothetical protein